MPDKPHLRIGVGLAALGLLLAGCGGGGDNAGSPPPVTVAPTPTPTPTPPTPPPPAPPPATIAIAPGIAGAQVALLQRPWAIEVLPDTRLLVTGLASGLQLVTQAGAVAPVSGLPAGARPMDIKVDPQFGSNRRLFISFQEDDASAPRVGIGSNNASMQPSGLAVLSATLVESGAGAALSNVQVIWRGSKTVGVAGNGHYGGRLAISPDRQFLFIASGDRQEESPAQRLDNTLGKIIRVRLDGSIPADNPFAGQSGMRGEIWSLGHRNPYGLIFTADGRLIEHEMGPAGGDELNLVERGRNYGWPNVSNGNHYDGRNIPDHSPGDGYQAPLLSWTPVIAPAGLIQYAGSLFAGWQGSLLLTGLQSNGLVRVGSTGASTAELQRIGLGSRIRDVEQAADGALWVIEDGDNARLLRLTPS